MTKFVRRLALPLLVSFVLLLPSTADAHGCEETLLLLSASGCTLIECQLDVGIIYLDGSGRMDCYYGRCVIHDVCD